MSVASRLLIVMADPDLRQTFVDVLAELGYPVGSTDDAVDAWVHLTAEPPPAVILIDLPRDRPGAAELFEALRTRTELIGTAIFVFDGHLRPNDAEPDLGLAHVFQLPVDLDTLLPALDAVLGR